MWIYKSPVGTLSIQRLNNGRYGFVYKGELWESCDTPQAEADNIYVHVTGCWEWDRLDGKVDAPTDLSEWTFIPDR